MKELYGIYIELPVFISGHPLVIRVPGWVNFGILARDQYKPTSIRKRGRS